MPTEKSDIHVVFRSGEHDFLTYFPAAYKYGRIGSQSGYFNDNGVIAWRYSEPYEVDLCGFEKGETEEMLVIKTSENTLPEDCSYCTYFSTRPHPYKGWTDACELCMQSLDDDQPDKGWIFDGNGRPDNCPLMEVVQCKDCIHWVLCDGATETVRMCEYARYRVDENGYCGYGERRGED